MSALCESQPLFIPALPVAGLTSKMALSGAFARLSQTNTMAPVSADTNLARKFPHKGFYQRFLLISSRVTFHGKAA
jgi:hypothetical protein